MDPWWQTAPEGATCSLHPQTLASATCPRCGSFACAACANPQVALCPACLSRADQALRFPFNAGNWSVGGLFTFCWEVFTREWKLLALAGLLFTVVVLVGSGIASVLQVVVASTGNRSLTLTVNLIVGLINNVVLGAMTMGAARFCAEVLDGKKAEATLVFSQFDKLGRYLPIAVLQFALFSAPALFLSLGLQPGNGAPDAALENLRSTMSMVGLFTLVLIPVGFFIGIPLQLAPAEMAMTRGDARAVLRNVFTMVRGTRWRVFAVMFLGAIVGSAGFLVCCVGILPGMAFFQLMITGVYLCVRNGNGLRPGR